MGYFSEIMDRLRGDDLYEMANVPPDETGLPYGIWISHRGRARHGPRIKAYPRGPKDQGSVIVVTVEEEPRVVQQPRSPRIPEAHLRQLEAFVRLNREVLVQYWHDDVMSTRAMLDRLQVLA